jgi:hypothetical protein
MTTQTPTRPASEQRHVRRVSPAIEQLPDAPDKLDFGRYSRGIEQMPDAPDKLRRGSFADGFAASK